MNIERIKNYNQKMLAAFSTILVITSAIGLILLLIFVITEFIHSTKPMTNVLLSDDKVEQLKKDNLRQQIISYDSPYLVDTLKLVYLLPVSTKTLEKPEEEHNEVLPLLDIRKDMSSTRKYRSESFFGTFNNLLVFDYRKNSTEKICDKRLIGTDLSFEYFDNEIIAAFTGAETDSDKDGKVTLNDFKSLFLYSFNDKKLKRINLKNSTVVAFDYIEKTKDILVRFGYDRNKNNIFDAETEPTIIMRYDYQRDTLITLVDKRLETEIQRLIDNN